MAKPKKPISKMDAIDLEAEREGASIQKSNEVRVKRSSKKPKIGPVDSRTLDKSFVDRYGNSGYTAEGDKDEKS